MFQELGENMLSSISSLPQSYWDFIMTFLQYLKNLTKNKNMEHINSSINTYYLFWRIVEMICLFISMEIYHKREKEVTEVLTNKNWLGVNITKVGRGYSKSISIVVASLVKYTSKVKTLGYWTKKSRIITKA